MQPYKYPFPHKKKQNNVLKQLIIFKYFPKNTDCTQLSNYKINFQFSKVIAHNDYNHSNNTTL